MFQSHSFVVWEAINVSKRKLTSVENKVASAILLIDRLSLSHEVWLFLVSTHQIWQKTVGCSMTCYRDDVRKVWNTKICYQVKKVCKSRKIKILFRLSERPSPSPSRQSCTTPTGEL